MKEIEVRDLRRKQMFQVDDEYLNGYARLCGANATLVYLSLCRHANRDQQAWPSIERIMQELGFGSHNTVRKAIKVLEEWGIVQIWISRDEKTKRQNVNVYTLVDKAHWKPKPVSRNDIGAGVTSEADPMSFEGQKPVSRNDMEGNTRRRKHIEGNTATSVEVAGASNEINSVLEKFQMLLNPTINYGNKTQRKAAEELIHKLGYERTMKAIEYAASIKAESFAPVITTPYQLKEKLGQLMAFYQKSSNKTPMAIRI